MASSSSFCACSLPSISSSDFSSASRVCACSLSFSARSFSSLPTASTDVLASSSTSGSPAFNGSPGRFRMRMHARVDRARERALGFGDDHAGGGDHRLDRTAGHLGGAHALPAHRRPDESGQPRDQHDHGERGNRHLGDARQSRPALYGRVQWTIHDQPPAVRKEQRPFQADPVLSSTYGASALPRRPVAHAPLFNTGQSGAR